MEAEMAGEGNKDLGEQLNEDLVKKKHQRKPDKKKDQEENMEGMEVEDRASARGARAALGHLLPGVRLGWIILASDLS